VRRDLNPQLKAAGGRTAWLAQQERSHMAVMRTYAWFALTLGRPAARLVLHAICAYFVIFSRRARIGSRKYLSKILGRRPTGAEIYRHFHTFAATVLDRLYLLRGEMARFDIRTFNEEAVRHMIERREGGFLLGAHIGSFEAIRALGSDVTGLKVRMVMYEGNAAKLNAVLAAVNPGILGDVIALGRVDSMLKVQKALDDGEFVGMLADRTIRGERTVRVDFLGASAEFPSGPLRIAALLGRPVILMVGLYRGGARYDIHFEPLVDMQGVSADERPGVFRKATERYAARLEHYCRLAPYNWFNFYDFWV